MEPGTELDDGKYRIVRALGKGGMGAVFEAENTRNRMRVAIKCLHQEGQSACPEATERLLREAEALGRVRHPNVVDVYDVGRDGELVFLVMEYLQGEPLTQFLARGQLPIPRVIALLVPAMRAVAAAHKQGVIHRDIKPDNIFLAREGGAADPTIKVLDFGISKLARQPGEQLTRAGTTLGTPIYMSYEQLLGVDDIDGRTDVYAFGVVLYEALTGRAPFEADTYSQRILKCAQPPDPPSKLRPELPSALESIVMRALATDRAERTPTMDALIEQLQRLLSPVPSSDRLVPAPPDSQAAEFRITLRRRKALRIAALSGSVLSLLMLAFSCWQWTRPSAVATSDPAPLAPAPLRAPANEFVLPPSAAEQRAALEPAATIEPAGVSSESIPASTASALPLMIPLPSALVPPPSAAMPAPSILRARVATPQVQTVDRPAPKDRGIY